MRIKRELDAMITDEAEKQRRIDLLSYQVQEIEDAGLTAGEEQTLEKPPQDPCQCICHPG